jgi:urease accessory protein
MASAVSHSHDGLSHSHANAGGDHGHSHDVLDGPGSYLGREMPIVEGRDWSRRAFTVGIGGYVSRLDLVLVVVEL